MVVQCERPPRVQDVAEALAMDKSSALRFLRTLVKHDLIQRDPRDKTYSPGIKLLVWSKGLKASTAIVGLARPHLRQLTQLTQQTSHLAVLRSDRVVLIEVMPSETAVSVRQTPGDWEPLYCTAVGKAILAFLPTVEQRQLIDQVRFRELTPQSITTREMLNLELRTVARQRLAFDDCENNPLICCIAAPVLDRTGYPVASIGISMLAALFPGGPRRQTGHRDRVRQAAEALTAALNRDPLSPLVASQ